jgi:hypothetical protein
VTDAPATFGAALSAIAVIGVGALGAYVNRRAETLATSEDIKKVLDQTEATTRVVEQIKTEVARSERAYELEMNYRTYQQPVLEEATRLLVRISTRELAAFGSHYDSPWDPSQIAETNPDANKRDTTVYRFARFWGAYRIYRERTAGLSPHTRDQQFRFYIDNKITATLAGGEGGVILRDSLYELGELCSRYSESWREMRPIAWFDFVALLKSQTEEGRFLTARLGRLARFLQTRSWRLWILGIYMLDLIQDTSASGAWERDRTELLSALTAVAPARVYLYGRVRDGQTDLSAMDLNAGLIPRNPDSPLYDRDTDPLGYGPTTNTTTWDLI